MRAHYLQHVAFEGLGSIESWLVEQGYQISCTPFYQSSTLPMVEEIDFLIIMGGPMSVNDEAQYPWLATEKQFVRAFIASGKPVLGICLGAQLIASAMGGRVYPNAEKEIGWFPVRGVTSGEAGTFVFPAETEVFHWHGETFTLPTGAHRLAQSAVCENQAFQLGANVIGLQFHLETTPQSAQALIEHCREELVAGAFIQTEQQIKAVDGECFTAINALMVEILTFLQAADV